VKFEITYTRGISSPVQEGSAFTEKSFVIELVTCWYKMVTQR